MKIIVAIPALNEERTLPKVIEEIRAALEGYTYEILVLDDGSTDATSKVAKSAGAIVVRNKRNQGLAYTFRREMRECLERGADVIVHTDADGQYPARFIPLMVEQIKSGADLVLGSRFGRGRYSGSFLKDVGNRMFARVLSRLLGVRLSDTTTGFRAFTAEVASIKIINRFTYTQEQIIKAANQGMVIREVPITTRKTRPSRLFSNPLQYALRAWVNILRIYRDYDPLGFFGRIGLLFIAAGVLLGLFITAHVIVTGSAGGIPRVVLSMLLVLMGVQIGLFGFLADMRAQ